MNRWRGWPSKDSRLLSFALLLRLGSLRTGNDFSWWLDSPMLSLMVHVAWQSEAIGPLFHPLLVQLSWEKANGDKVGDDPSPTCRSVGHLKGI